MSDEPARSQSRVELEDWQKWLENLREAGAALLRLASAELQLAAGDLRRFLLLSLLVLPVAILAWLGFALFLSWVAYSVSGSLGAGFAGFFLLHFFILLAIRQLMVRYRKSLSMPLTREHLGEIMEALQHEPRRADTAD